MKRLIAILPLLFLLFTAHAEEPDAAIPFVTYGDTQLKLDIYMPEDSLSDRYCVIFAYGGGFMDNFQRDSSVIKFCRRLASDGYVAIAPDYRLGLKGYVMKGILDMIKPFRNALQMATEDEVAAISFVLAHASELGINKDRIILCGSSAGAIMSLQTDYELCNRTPVVTALPEDFHFAGVAAFAGAIYSDKGPCKYEKHDPAPTLFVHGTEDKLVTYRKLAFANEYLGGSNDLQKIFAANGWPHEIIRFKGIGHWASCSYMRYYDEFIWFVDNFVKENKSLEIDKTLIDHDLRVPDWDKALSSSPNNLYK